MESALSFASDVIASVTSKIREKESTFDFIPFEHGNAYIGEFNKVQSISKMCAQRSQFKRNGYTRRAKERKKALDFSSIMNGANSKQFCNFTFASRLKAARLKYY